MARADETEQLRVPSWVVSMRSKLDGNVAHAFLLEGNVRDYMVRNISIKDGIIQTLDPGQDAFEVIASYDQAHGLTFDTYTLGDAVDPAEYRGRFVELMGEAQDRLGIPRTADVPKDPVALFSVISEIVDMPAEVWEDGRERAKLLLFVDYPEMLVPQTATSPRESERQLAIIINDMCRSELADQGGSCIVMTTDDVSLLSERVRSTSSRVDRVNVPMPLLAERRDFIHNVLAVDENRLGDGRRIFECKEGVDESYLAVNTAGLACFQIEDIVLRALADDTAITPELVKERKNEIIMNDYNEIIEIMEPKYGFDAIGGLQSIKDFFMREVINPIQRNELEGVPMGVLLMGPPGTSKPLLSTTPIYKISSDMSPVLTTMGELEVGDYVYNLYGGPTRVVDVRPRGELEAYELVLKDGRTVVCSKDHVWGTYKLGEKLLHERTVEEMLAEGLYDDANGRVNRSRFYIPMNPYIQFPERNLPIDPYVVGCFLGDGCCTLRSLTLSSSDTGIVDEVTRLIGSAGGHKLAGSFSWVFRVADDRQVADIRQWKKGNGKFSGGTIKNIPTDYFFRDVPELIGDAHHKRIPEAYMHGSVEQRFALVQGLLDTDGCIHRDERYQFRGNVSFSSVNKGLIDDFREVLFSLGIGSTLTVSDRRGTVNVRNGKEYVRKNVEYRVNINCPNELKPRLFRLVRKRERALRVRDIVKGRNYSHVAITDIRPLNIRADMTCITVDGPYGLFLVGRDYVVTHNTLMSKAVAKESNMNCVNLNLNRILNKYVGGSEHNLDRALDCAMAMEPTIIFIDEIDEALPKRNGADQTGISQRINKRLLEFLSDTSHRGQVMILAATNYPEKVDPAFKRAGRFDNRLPMFAPGPYDRARILHISAAKARYTISKFRSPDYEVPNYFHKALKAWLEQGNIPMADDMIYDMTDYEYDIKDSTGQVLRMSVPIPRRLLPIVTARKITLEDFYRTIDMLVARDLPSRGAYEAGIAVLSDEQYRAGIAAALRNSGVVNPDPRAIEQATELLIDRDRYLTPFGDLTVGKTGAELDVVINKCISLYRTWKAEHPDGVRRLVQQKQITGERDIPWFIVLEACKKTTAAVSGIKSMEDFALIDTSDTDYIPDEVYGRTKSNTPISYRERQEQLLTRLKSAVDRESAELLE